MQSKKRLVDLNYIFPGNTYSMVTGDPWKTFDKLLDRLISAPVIDAVEVVRCGDCVYRRYSATHKAHWCDRTGGIAHAVLIDDYCSYGKGKDDK